MNEKRRNITSGSFFEEALGFSRAVRIGNTIAIGGTAPIGEDGETVGVGDAAAQARQCWKTILQALEEAGSGPQDVIRTRTLLVNIKDWEAVGAVRTEIFCDIRPVETVMEISGFINPEWLVEIEVDAVLSE